MMIVDTFIHFFLLLIVFGAIWYILTLLPLPAPIMQIAQVVLAVILLLLLLGILMGQSPYRGTLFR